MIIYSARRPSAQLAKDGVMRRYRLAMPGRMLRAPILYRGERITTAFVDLRPERSEGEARSVQNGDEFIS